MQFNLVNDEEQVAQFVRRGVVWHSVAGRGVSVRVYCWGMPEAFVARVFCWAVGCLPRAFSGSSSGQRLLCILGVRLRMASWLWLGSVFGVVAFVCFLVFHLSFCAVLVSEVFVLFRLDALVLVFGAHLSFVSFVFGFYASQTWFCLAQLATAWRLVSSRPLVLLPLHRPQRHW